MSRAKRVCPIPATAATRLPFAIAGNVLRGLAARVWWPPQCTAGTGEVHVARTGSGVRAVSATALALGLALALTTNAVALAAGDGTGAPGAGDRFFPLA